MKKVLFVCTANICRSPTAQAVFDALAEDHGLPFRATSAGTAALEGRSTASKAIAALEEVGIYPQPHRARQIDGAMVEEAELVLTMTPQHAATVGRLLPGPPDKIRTLLQYSTGEGEAGISDPYGLTMAAYRSTLRQIYEHVERVVIRLSN